MSWAHVFKMLAVLTLLTVTATLPTAFAEAEKHADDSHQTSAESHIGWPSPVMDSENFGLLLFDLLEYKSIGSQSTLNWDIESWRGGDLNRVWIKSEGSTGVGASRSGDADLQVLYGRLVTAFFDAQIGVRHERAFGEKQNVSRTSAVVGMEGLSLYVAEVEAVLFIGDSGYVAAQLTASKDFLFTQKTIAQVRLETSGAAVRSPQFETGSGLNDLSLGLRLRYEIKRELAPYLGITWDNYYGETADFRKRGGGDAASVNAVAGLRMWY
jgi:copper resistance protein B